MVWTKKPLLAFNNKNKNKNSRGVDIGIGIGADDDDDDSLANEIVQLAEAERKLQEALAQAVEASKLQLDQQLAEAERALVVPVHPSDSLEPLEESKTIVFYANTNGFGDEQLMDDSNIIEWQPSTDLDNHEYMEDTISCAHESSISESVPQ